VYVDICAYHDLHIDDDAVISDDVPRLTNGKLPFRYFGSVLTPYVLLCLVVVSQYIFSNYVFDR
jgi:hypothetical protein